MSSVITSPAPAVNVPEKTPLVSCYYLGDYEENRYHDSYFRVVYWDDVAGKVCNVEYAATAYGGGWNWHAELIRDIPADVLARFRESRYRGALEGLTVGEIARVMTPTPQGMPFGTTVRLLKDSRKGCKTPYAKGETGEVTGQYWFGTFYGNGYNTRNRHNGRLGVRMADGRTVFCAMTVVRLDCEPDMAAVERNAQAARYSLPCPHAWWTALNSVIESRA